MKIGKADNMRVLFNDSGDGRRWDRGEAERSRTRESFRDKIYSRSVIPRIIAKNFSKTSHSSGDMSRVPLIAAEKAASEKATAEKAASKAESRNVVIFEVGLSSDTWRYCVERERLAARSEVFRAMLVGPLAPEPSDPPPLLRLEHVEKRAFNCFLKYLQNEPINFQSVSTARATLDVAHQYLCSELACLAVAFLEDNLNSSTVLDIYQGLSLYANDIVSTAPSAPPAPGDDATEIAVACTRLLVGCMSVIDSDPAAVLRQERFEELGADEVAKLVGRDTLRLTSESVLFTALDRWAASECRRHGVEPTSVNKRAALPDEVWYSVRYPLMTDREFIEGPMISGILSSEESAFIVSRILGHHQSCDNADDIQRSTVVGPLLSRLSAIPRMGARMHEDQGCRMSSKPGKRERQDNRKNRRKECTSQGQKACARIGNCIVRVLACVFD